MNRTVKDDLLKTVWYWKKRSWKKIEFDKRNDNISEMKDLEKRRTETGIQRYWGIWKMNGE